MWIVFDLDAKPEADRPRSEDGEPVIYDTVEEAMKDLGERIAFSIGYLADPDGDDPTQALPEAVATRISTFAKLHGENPTVFTSLRYDTEDGYAHIAVLISAFAQAGFRTGGVLL